MIKRYAIVRGLNATPEVVAKYLPRNYRVLATARREWAPGKFDDVVVIQGEDTHGWGLDNYIRPRLASGLMGCEEIDLSHPIMRQIPDNFRP